MQGGSLPNESDPKIFRLSDMPTRQQEDSDWAFMHISEFICLLFAFLLTATADLCEDKGLGRLSPSSLLAPSASEETMTQKTNGPDALTMVMISPPVIFLLDL